MMSSAPVGLTAMAERLVDDGLGWLPIADRCHAAVVLDRVRLGLGVSDDDARRVSEIYARRQLAIATLALDYAAWEAAQDGQAA